MPATPAQAEPRRAGRDDGTRVDIIGQDGTFWLYAGFGVLAIAYFWWRVPETKNRSLEEIERDLGVKEPDRTPARAS